MPMMTEAEREETRKKGEFQYERNSVQFLPSSLLLSLLFNYPSIHPSIHLLSTYSVPGPKPHSE